VRAIIVTDLIFPRPHPSFFEQVDFYHCFQMFNIKWYPVCWYLYFIILFLKIFENSNLWVKNTWWTYLEVLNISNTNCLTNNNKDIISNTVVVEYNVYLNRSRYYQLHIYNKVPMIAYNNTLSSKVSTNMINLYKLILNIGMYIFSSIYLNSLLLKNQNMKNNLCKAIKNNYHNLQVMNEPRKNSNYKHPLMRLKTINN